MIDIPAEDFPVDVVVTRTTTPGGQRVVLLRLDNGNERRPEALGPVGLDRLGLALDAVTDADAVVLTGTGRTFCAGANLDTLSGQADYGDALQLAQEGHRVMSKLTSLGIPTVAAINGTALGGGFELALHCTHRVAQSDARNLGLPEIGLGLIPGWGGATLLPRLIGMTAALRIMVDNAIAGTFLSASGALEIGVVDRVADDAVDGALALIDERDDSPRPVALDANHDTIVADALAKFVNRASNPLDALVHLQRILEATGMLSITESFEAEDAALADLAMSSEFRARLYSFRVTSGASKVPLGTPNCETTPISRVGVVGAGLMASQIGLACAEGFDAPVIITDVEQSRLDAATERIAGWLDARVAKGALSAGRRDEIEARVSTTLDIADFAECDLVIEAVFENLDVKRDVFDRLSTIVRPDAILASNTSSLSVSTIADFATHPERVAGIHFFNPVGAMKLVEVVRHSAESDVTLATAVDIARRLGKTPVLVADQAGFVVNRLLSVFLGEALRLVEIGTSVADVSLALAPLRLPMTPFQLIDLIGRQVTLSMLRSLQSFAPERFFVGEALENVTANPSGPVIADELSTMVMATSTVSLTDIHETVVDALAREVRMMLDDGVVLSASDIDLCMMNGAGWPSAIGGLTPYLDGCGASERATGGLFHPDARFD